MAVSNQMTVTIKGDASSLNSALKVSEKQLKDFSSSAEDAGEKGAGASNKIMTAFKVLAASAVIKSVADAIIGVTKASVQAYAEYEQLVGGVDTLFKESSAKLQSYANEAYKTAQISANEYMSTVTSFSASLLQSLGGDTEAAAEYANQAIIDMADNANKMGTSMESIQNAYQGFAKQNYTMLDNLKLGYGGTKEEMQRLLDDASKLSGMQFDISSFSDITQAIHIVQQELGITGTSAEEASNTITGSLNMMKSAWQNTLTSIAGGGENMDTSINNLLTSVGSFAQNIIPVIKTALSGLASLVGSLAPVIVQELPGLMETVLPPLLEALTDLVIQLTLVWPDILSILAESLLAALPEFLNSLMEILPVMISAVTSLIISLAQAITQPTILNSILQAGIRVFMEIVRALPTVLVSLVDALPQIITNIVSFLVDPGNIGMIIGAAVELFFGIVSAVPQILGALLGAFGSLVGKLWNGITDMFANFAGNFGEFITNIFKGAINGVIGFIEGFVNTPINILNGFIDIINGAFGFIGVNLGKISRVSLPRLENGGIIPGTSYTGDRQLAMVNSGEMVINRSQQAALWNAISTGNYAPGNSVGDIYINVDATGQSDPSGIAVEIAKAMKQAFDDQGLTPNLAYAGSLR